MSIFTTSALGTATITTAGNTTISYPYTTTSTYAMGTTVSPSTFTINYKKCRDCNHAHLNDQCIEYTADWGSITFVNCQCKEYIPAGNLEYLEYLYDKKRRKESSSSL